MKNLLLLFSLALFTGTASLHASSNKSYYYHGKQVPLSVNFNAFFISSATNADLTAVFSQYGYTIEIMKEGTDANAIDGNLYWKVVKITNVTLTESGYNSLRQRLKSNNALLACPVLGSKNIPVSDYFYVKLRSPDDLKALNTLATQTGSIVLPALSHLPLWFPVKTNAGSTGNSLELANYFYETGKFSMVSPDFMIQAVPACTNDPDFSQQWGLKNTTYPGIDIRACDAWQKTKGSSSVKVAFVDDGMVGTHFVGSPSSVEFAGNNLIHYDTDSGHTVPYHAYYGYHATGVAAILGANHNSSYISGVAPLSSILDVKFDFTLLAPQQGAKIANGMAWACANGAAIMNCSWLFINDSLQTQLLEDAIDDAIVHGRNGLGTLMVFAVGNYNAAVVYPAKYRPEIMAVGGISKNGNRTSFACYGPELDVVAPAEDIATFDVTPTTFLSWGTSLAAPAVAGAAALALAVNPCLTEEELRFMIEYSAKKINSGSYNYSNNMNRPNGTWNNELGYGLLDAKRVVDIADSMKKNTVDLYIKDRPFDFGMEPNSDTGPCWISDDIWIRLLNDDIVQHQNPAPGQQVFIKVKIRNKSCANSEPSTLKVYWAKASTGLSWPAPWNGSAGPGTGGTLVTSIPSIQAGGYYIATIPWVAPSGGFLNHHFCLMAEVIHANDPLKYNPAGGDLGRFVRDNNNVAQKNITIIDALHTTGFVTAGSFGPMPANGNRLVFKTLSGESGIPVTAAAEVRIGLSTQLWNKWVQGGSVGQGFRVVDETNHEILALQPILTLGNLNFNPGDVNELNVKVNFLTDAVTGTKKDFIYDLMQQNNQGVSTGGERFQIIRSDRVNMFQAQGTAQQQQNLITLTANSIGEPATYNWFTPDSTFIGSGLTIQTPATGLTAYLLQVTAAGDGFRDYAQVAITGAPGQILSIAPNPVTTEVTVRYQLSPNIQTAQLKIASVNNPRTLVSLFNIKPDGTQTTIQLQNLAAGVYTISLYANGQLQDTQQLIKQ